MQTWARGFMEHLSRGESVSESTLAGYSRDLKDFASAMERMGVDAPSGLQTYHIQSYLNGLRTEGRSAATLARRLVSIRALCRFGSAERILGRDPAAAVDSPRVESPSLRVLTSDEVDRLLEAPDPASAFGLRDKAMLELLYATGIRVSELVALNAGDADADIGYLRCAGSGGRERLVPMGAIASGWLKRYLADAAQTAQASHGTDSPMFPGHLGTRMTRQGLWKIIKKYAQAAGLSADLTPQTLRSSFAVHLLENGADVRAVQEMLGHASPLTTQRYQKPERAKLKDVYDRTHPRAR